jgi:uncharacterized protein
MRLLQTPFPITAVVHLPPLPGAPIDPKRPRDVLDAALHDAILYRRSGVDALLIENHGDAPFEKDDVAPHVPALMALVVDAVAKETGLPVGVNVLRNDVRAALGVAAAAGGSFARANVWCGVAATDQGLLESRAAEVLQYRRRLASSVEIWADVDVKFSTSLYAPSIETLVRGAATRSGADRILVTGDATGAAPNKDFVLTAKAAAANVPVLVASGVDRDNVGELFAACDGAIVGSAFKEGGDVRAPIDPGAVVAFMNDVRSLRRSTSTSAARAR